MGKSLTTNQPSIHPSIPASPLSWIMHRGQRRVNLLWPRLATFVPSSSSSPLLFICSPSAPSKPSALCSTKDSPQLKAIHPTKTHPSTFYYICLLGLPLLSSSTYTLFSSQFPFLLIHLSSRPSVTIVSPHSPHLPCLLLSFGLLLPNSRRQGLLYFPLQYKVPLPHKKMSVGAIVMANFLGQRGGKLGGEGRGGGANQERMVSSDKKTL